MPTPLQEPLRFDDVARVPAPGDNVAIALRTLPARSHLLIRQLVLEFAHTILEGHRFAIHRIRKGEPLLSWGLPFGLATRDIETGEYLCNEKILRVLAERTVDLVLPKAPNFVDHRLAFALDESRFTAGRQVCASQAAPTFQGFRRNARRGAGTRNYVVLLGTNSRTAGFVHSLARRFNDVGRLFPNIDGVVPVGHTEGGSNSRALNFDLTLRTLAGFIVNPNVAAVLCVDFAADTLSNSALRDYLRQHNYPLDGLLHDFFSIDSSFEAALNAAEEKVRGWLHLANQFSREPIPLRYLKLGLQCGGSDAFSGISANPLVGLLSRDTVAFGGSASLAETDELIGAEQYVLQNVRDLATAQRFLAMRDHFQEWAASHGHSAEGNPSGGNNFRGLYNITIKSIGAARKKDPATRLDYVIDFGELMPDPGFYFMNSPGNDLESIAGQVASGCNLILFATGNGSITNFPFVPTIKLMTTTRRFELVQNEMDFNAGRYLDGESMETLGREAFTQMLDVASGQPSAGERAGHSQVQLWREWRGPHSPDSTEHATDHATPISGPDLPTGPTQPALPAELLSPAPPARVGLVLPTSLCAGQIAALIAQKLNHLSLGAFSRVIALPHTEGCGNSAGESEQLFLRTMSGYLAHPLVARAVLLEHGCEKTHNDAFLHTLRELHLDPARYGFASIQLDGGIERVTQKVLGLFASTSPPPPATLPFSVGLAAASPTPRERETIRSLISLFDAHGLTTVTPESLRSGGASLQYGERFTRAGAFQMRAPTEDLLEIITGLAATGVELVVLLASAWPVPGNPLVPTLQVAFRERLGSAPADFDLLVSDADPADAIVQKILQAAAAVRSGRAQTRGQQLGNTAFQITRGYTGISL